MLEVYCYNPKTGEFLNKMQVHKNPLEEGKFLIPTSATTIAPPSTGKNETSIFKNGTWLRVKDFRGKLFYNKITKAVFKIILLGDIPSEIITKYTEKKPTSENDYVVFDDISKNWVENEIQKDDFETETKSEIIFNLILKRVACNEMLSISAAPQKMKDKATQIKQKVNKQLQDLLS